VHDEQVDGDEARHMKQDERAEVDRIDPVAKRAHPKVGEHRNRGEKEREGGQGEGGHALQDEEVSGDESRAEPQPEEDANQQGDSHDVGPAKGRSRRGARPELPPRAGDDPNGRKKGRTRGAPWSGRQCVAGGLLRQLDAEALE
jgi:hypothetical protein